MKRYHLIYFIILGVILGNCFSIVVHAENPAISHFSLANYKEKAGIHQNHTLTIAFDKTISLTKSDISYKIIGDEKNVSIFKDCVDISLSLDSNNFTFFCSPPKFVYYFK